MPGPRQAEKAALEKSTGLPRGRYSLAMLRHAKTVKKRLFRKDRKAVQKRSKAAKRVLKLEGEKQGWELGRFIRTARVERDQSLRHSIRHKLDEKQFDTYDAKPGGITRSQRRQIEADSERELRLARLQKQTRMKAIKQYNIRKYRADVKFGRQTYAEVDQVLDNGMFLEAVNGVAANIAVAGAAPPAAVAPPAIGNAAIVNAVLANATPPIELSSSSEFPLGPGSEVETPLGLAPPAAVAPPAIGNAAIVNAVLANATPPIDISSSSEFPLGSGSEVETPLGLGNSSQKMLSPPPPDGSD